jgi:hypothetical protein
MALLVHRLAPKAKIYDLPLLPERIDDLQTFLNLAAAAMLHLLAVVHADVNRRWVLCNAWSVYRLDQDAPLSSVLNYGQNPNNEFTTSGPVDRPEGHWRGRRRCGVRRRQLRPVLPG